MKYLYTTEPDEQCHEVEPGIWGRPVHTSYQAELKEQGWTSNIKDLKGDDHVREEKEGREEEGEVSVDGMSFEDYLRIRYEEVIGKKPHHKMKRETMQEKIAEAEANDNDPV